jgi:hypothetical protein
MQTVGETQGGLQASPSGGASQPEPSPAGGHPPQRSGRAGPAGPEARGADGQPHLLTHSPTTQTAVPASGLVVTGQNGSRIFAGASVAEILGLRFPGEADVRRAAEALGKATRESRLRSQIDVSPGSIRLRRTVPDDPDRELSGAGGDTSPRKPITAWTAKSRRQMARSFAALDFSPMFAGNGISVQVTLTYPDDWLTVAPTRLAVQRHFKIFESRFVRAWGEPVVCLWKLEYQRRGAPHYHLLMRRPDGVAGQYRRTRFEAAMLAWEAAGRHGRRPYYRPAHADGLRFGQWLAATWADIVNHPDPDQRARHLAAGTRVDVKAGLRGTDPKRASVYFSKHGLDKKSKEYQNKPPAEWVKAGGGPGRYWGYLGLSQLVMSAQVDCATDYYQAKRTLRRWSARTRLWDQQTLSARYVKATRPVRVQRGGRVRTVRRPVARLGGLSGTLCVNDGPAMAGYLARVIALSVKQDQAASIQRTGTDRQARALRLAELKRRHEHRCEWLGCAEAGRLYPCGRRCDRHRPGEVDGGRPMDGGQSRPDGDHPNRHHGADLLSVPGIVPGQGRDRLTCGDDAK